MLAICPCMYCNNTKQTFSASYRNSLSPIPIKTFSYTLNTGKKGETNTEVVYEEPKDYLEPRKSKDDGGREIMVQECPAYENPREVDVEMEECQAYGKLPNTR